MSAWLDWIREHKELLFWSGVGSVVMFVGTLIVIPILITKMGEDYFMPDRKEGFAEVHPVLRIVGIIVKNLLGVVVLLMGVVMIFIPGQGLLTILLGVVLMDFPRKRKFELWLVKKEPVLKSINWMRRKAGKPPLQIPTAPSPARPPPARDASS